MIRGANPRSRICLRFTAEGLVAFANREALIDLRDRLDWLARTPADEVDSRHFHVLSLENYESLFEGRRPRNAGVCFDIDFAEAARTKVDNRLIADLTFVTASEAMLDEVQSAQV